MIQLGSGDQFLLSPMKLQYKHSLTDKAKLTKLNFKDTLLNASLPPHTVSVNPNMHYLN